MRSGSDNLAVSDGPAVRAAKLAAIVLTYGIAIAAAVFSICKPISAASTTPSGIVLTAWQSRTAYLLFWPTFAVIAAFSAFGIHLVRRLAPSLPDRTNAIVSSLQPLVTWPCLTHLGHASAWLGTAASSAISTYGTVLIAALVLFRLHERNFAGLAGFRTTKTRNAFLGVMAAAYLAIVIGIGAFTSGYFNGGGDVPSYMVQTQNLVERGNLDLTDMMCDKLGPNEVTRSAFDHFIEKNHLKVNSEGRIYCYHSYGFPLLMALVRGDKPACRLPAMALITLLASIGCYLAARTIGAPRRESFIATALTSMSFMWIFHGISFLPEMLGITLTAWAFWAIPAQSRKSTRIAATAVSAIACSYLPFAHIRFLPAALMLFGFFGIEGLLQTEESFWKRRAPRLLVYGLVCLAAWFVLYHSQKTMFSAPPKLPENIRIATPNPTVVNAQTTTMPKQPKAVTPDQPAKPATAPKKVPDAKSQTKKQQGGPYDYGRILMQYPMAMWGMFADRRGLVCLFPLIWWLALAPLPAILRRKPTSCDEHDGTTDPLRIGELQAKRNLLRRSAAYALLTSIAILCTCCSTDASLVGLCINGRYFAPAIPLLLPIAACLLATAGRPARLWFFFLALIPVLYGIIALFAVRSSSIIYSPSVLWSLDGFVNLWQPLPSCMYTADSAAKAFGFIFAGGMMLFTLMAVFHRRSKALLIAATIAFAVAIAAGFRSDRDNRSKFKHSFFAFCNHGKMKFFTASRKSDEDYFTTVLGRKWNDPEHRMRPEEHYDSLLALSSSPDRGISCYDFVRPGDGHKACTMQNADGGTWYKVRPNPVRLRSGVGALFKIRGRVTAGKAIAVAAHVKGVAVSPTVELPPGEFEAVLEVPPYGKSGSYNVFLSLDGNEGTSIVDEILYTPYLPGLEKALGCKVK